MDPSLDMGLYELLHQFQHRPECPSNLEPVMARQIATMAEARARETARCQSPGDRQAIKPLMAHFDREEIELGALLGIGGFSNVYEIQSFDSHKSRHYSKEQRLAREFLAQHALRLQEVSSRDIGKIVDSSAESEDAETLKKPDHLARYAIKHLRKSLLQTPEKFAKAAMDLACEAEMMLCLDHPNIVKLRGWTNGGPASFKDGENDSYFLIIDRLIETLQDRIWMWRKQWKKEDRRKQKTVVKWMKKIIQRKKEEPAKEEKVDSLLVERLKVAYDISCSLEYLHERRIIYRDLKTSNIGFDIRGDVKIFDFGLARFLPTSTGDSDESFRMSNVGTRRYTPPEVTQKKPYNLKADVYTFGVVMWEILTMCSPKGSAKGDQQKPRLSACSCWPSELQTLVESMVFLDPSERPTINHVRATIKDLLVTISDAETSAEILKEGTLGRRRSTFRLESFNLEELGLKDLDEDPNVQSHTSICTSFST
jgi:serine/threonine protein kinase